MTRTWRLTIVSLIVSSIVSLIATVLVVVEPAFAHEVSGDKSPKTTAMPLTGDLPEFLALVPDTPEYRDYLSWSDIEAWYEATGNRPVANPDDVDMEVLGEMTRQTQPASALAWPYLAKDEMAAVYGFGPLDAQQSLEAGAPPHTLTIVQAAVEPSEIESSLVQAGYAETPIPGGALYARGEEYALDLKAETTAGKLGYLNRIALLSPSEEGEATVEIARAGAVITESVAARSDEVDSLADNRDYRALVDVLTSTDPSEGSLVSLILMEGPVVTGTNAYTSTNTDAFNAMVEGYASEPLSRYSLAGFATFRAEDFTELGVFLVLASGDDPGYVAQLLSDRMSDYQSAVTGEKLGDRWETQTVGSYQGERNIAWVTMRLKPEDENPLNWSELLLRRDVAFLLTE